MTSPVFRAVAAFGGVTASATYTPPAGVIAGDLLLVHYRTSSSPPTPLGWQQLARINDFGSVYTALFRVATGNALDQLALNDLGVDHSGAFTAYNPVVQAPGPVVGVATATAARQLLADSTFINPTCTAQFTVNQPVTLVGLSAANTSGSPTSTGSAGLIERLDVAGASSHRAVYEQAVAGGTHSKSVTTEADRSVLFLVALRSNNPPNAPTVAVPASVDLTAPLVVDVVFSDPDSADSASQSLVRFRKTGTTAWTTVSRQSPQTQVTIPADTLTAGDYELQGASRDAGGLPVLDVDLRWSASVFFTAATPPPGPVFTTPAAGATIPTNSQEFVVSIPVLEALEWRVLGDLNGAADPANIINAGGIIATGDLRRFTATGLPNSTTVHAQARAKQSGLFGPWTTTTNLVSYTPPAAPGFVLQAVQTVEGSSGTDAIRVTPSIPVPAAGQPATAFLDIFVRRALQPGGAQRKRAGQAPSSPWTWLTPAAGVNYEVQVVAVAANGSRTASAWSGATAVPVAGGTSNAYDTAVYDTATYA